MRLVSLTLQGFKSFADRTTVEFTDPVTAIVGPNGSGKSNLIDALRWASSGGRAGEFRASDKRELIFHGSSGKRSLGFAEVTLGLEHGGRHLNVARTLTRDGESKLKVGGRTARFLDLEDELSGTGLGRGGLAVIGQGEVSSVLMADPPKLLAYVAESVGVAKLASRREGTLASLEQAEAHLIRLDDLCETLRERAEVLALEAAEAERAAELTREGLRLRFTLSLRRVEGLTAELAGLRDKGAELEAQLLAGRKALSDAQTVRQTAKHQLTLAESRYRQFMADAEARRGDVRVAAEQLRGAEAQLAATERDQVRVVSELEGLAALTPPEPLEGTETDHEETLAAAQAHEAALQRDYAAVRAEVSARREALLTAERAEAEAAQARARFAANREGLLEQLAGVEAQVQTLTPTDIHTPEAALREADEALVVLRGRLETLQEALVNVQREHAAAFADAQARAQAVSRQRAAFEARRGYAQGPKSALTSGIDGVIGSVADLITVPSEYAQAVGGALGRRAEHVVVESSGVAQRVLAHVRQAGGWVTLLPLDLMQNRVQTLSPALQAEESVIALASDVTESDARFRGLVQGLLSGTALVTTLPDAVALAIRYRTRPRLVTLTGDVLEAYGAISGGRSGGAGLMLGAAADLRRAERDTETAQALAETLTQTLKDRQTEVKAQQREVAAAQLRQQAAAKALATAREAAAAGASLEADLARRALQLQDALTALGAPPQTESADLVPLQEGLKTAQTEEEQVQAALGDTLAGVAAAHGALALWRERKRAFDAAAARFAEAQTRTAALRSQLDSLTVAAAEAVTAKDAAAAALTTAEAALPTADAPEEAAYKRAQRTEKDAEATLETLTRQQAALAGELETLNLTLARREAAFELAETEHRGFPEGVMALPGGPRALRERLSEVEAELESLGPVNHRAAQEYAAQRARLADLSAQMNDARSAAAELAKVLSDLDDAVRVRLVSGTNALAQGFAHYAERLFGTGAQASAELTWAEGRPAGLKLSLQPPTKQTRALSLLSVGERTMGALAFLFALMSSTADAASGLPLAILDEVDAPLDEANIRRFCAFLGELSRRGTQFVLITHQKATMEVASSLWGVTTQGGVSRVFSIRREAADAPVT